MTQASGAGASNGGRSTMVDWDLAASAAAKIAGPGPSISREEAAAVVAELRQGAARSTPLVREYTGLTAAERSAPVLIVDRAGWIQANVDGFAGVISPLIDKLQERKGAPGPMAQAVGSRVTGLELGGLLGFLSSKVLGQFDPFYGPLELPSSAAGGAAEATDSDLPATSTGSTQNSQPQAPGGQAAGLAGRLLLVAPNIVHVERELGVEPHDFRLWVCLHEETHRVQFTAVPWMRDHIHGEIAKLVGSVEVDPGKLLADAIKRLGDLINGHENVSLLDLMQTPEQKVVIDRLTGVMSLLEGHADVVMDGVGPEVIPTVKEIRRKFNQRRKGAGSLDRLLRRLLGLDQKMAQYRDGAKFVRGVVEQVGMEGFNKVWVEPANLPSKPEIGDPTAWVRRVHG